MNDRVLRTVIEGYTREAGVRELERTFARVARKAAVEYAGAEDGRDHRHPG